MKPVHRELGQRRLVEKFKQRKPPSKGAEGKKKGVGREGWQEMGKANGILDKKSHLMRWARKGL